MATSDDKNVMDISEFRSVYESEGQYNLTVQIPYLAKLAEHYEKLGSEDPATNWRSILQAHSLFNSCAARQQDTAEQFLQKAVDIQNMYNKAAELPHVQYNELLNLKLIQEFALSEIRKKCREKLEPLLSLIESYQEEPENLDSEHNHIVEEKIFTEMRSISINCNNDMIGVANNIITESMQLIGTKPPCSFSAIAMGSLAREEATPYSDLEFFFVIEENNAMTEPYFERLAMTVYFLIGNLQETNLKYMDIEELEGWFVDEGKSGLKIDGLRANAGNIPTGNGKTDVKNKYICTVDSLVDRYEMILNDAETESSCSVTGDDSDMMAYLRLISSYGDQGSALNDQLNSRLTKIHPNEKRVQNTLRTILKDMAKYDISPIWTLSKGSCMEMKTEVYRYPSLLLLNMNILFQSHSASTWETIEILKQDEQLAGFPSSFSYYFSVCLLIRLASYLYLNSQSERMSLSKINYKYLKEQSPKLWHIPQKVLLIYFITMFPAKLGLARMFSDNDKDTNTDDPMLMNAERLLSVIAAKITIFDLASVLMYAEYIPESLYSTLPENLLLNIAVSYRGHDNTEMAYRLITSRQTWAEVQSDNIATALKWQLTLYLGKSKENRRHEVRVRELLCQKPLDPDTASSIITTFYRVKKSGYCLPFDLALLDIDYPDDPYYLVCRGLLCMLKEEYDDSLRYHLAHLSYLDNLMGKGNASSTKLVALNAIAQLHYSIGEHRNRIGQTRKAQEQYEASLKRYEEALEMSSALGNRHHQAQCLHGISECHIKIKSFTLAEEALRKSVKMYIDLYGEKSMNVIKGYKNLYHLNLRLEKFKMAELYLQKHKELKLYLSAADQTNK